MSVKSHGWYFTVIIPYREAGATQWHPTDRNFAPLTRGAFKTRAKANEWAKAHLNGGSYRVEKRYNGELRGKGAAAELRRVVKGLRAGRNYGGI